MDPAEIVDRIARNELTEFDIDWREYQRLVWWLVSRETKINVEPMYRSEIDHGEDSGVVDIVVRLETPPVTLFGGPNISRGVRIFIECKQYRATLTLDKVGKVFCHSILEEPDALWIVSPRRLSSQAIDYARKIFSTGDSAIVAPLLKRTTFRHWRLRDLIDGTTQNVTAGTPIADWQIVQLTPFGTSVVASASSTPDTRGRAVYSDRRSSLQLRLLGDIASRAPDNIEIALECGDGPVTLLNRATRTDDEIVVDILPSSISGRQVTGILVGDPTTVVAHRVDVGRLSFQDFDAKLFDLRPHAPGEIAGRLARDPRSRVTCVAGPAGVGKSTLLEQVAWNLGRDHGWDVRAHTVTENTDYSLFYDLAEWFALAVAPLELIEVNRRAHDPRYAIVSTIAYRHSGLQTPEAVQQLLEAAARGAINEAQVQQLTRILAKVAKAREVPLLVVLRDFHSASPSVQRALLQLFVRLRDEGWGGVRFLVETRLDATVRLTEFEEISQLAERLGSEFNSVEVGPLTLEELDLALRTHIRASSFNEMARRIHDLTGGYPLLVDQLLRDLISRAVMIKADYDSDRYSIDVQALRGIRPDGVAPQLDSFLRGCLQRALISTDSNVMAASLGIAAQILRVAPEGAPRTLIAEIVSAGLGVSIDAVDECLAVATNFNFLRPEDASRAVVFAHDATRSMAASFALRQAGFLRIASSTATNDALSQHFGRFRGNLLQAHIAFDIGRIDRAVGLALAAEADVVESSNLLQRRLALECALHALTRNDRPDSAWARNELAVRERLIWTVMQQASQHFARMTIAASERRLASMHGARLISSSEQRAAAFHYARCRVVIGTRGLNARELIDTLPAMCESAVDTAHLHFALTRLVLVAIEIDDAESACRGIEYCLRLPVIERDEEARLSLLSEIGDMFTIEDVAIELAVSKVALELAESLLKSGNADARLHAHATVNWMRATARSGEDRLDETLLQSCVESWTAQGFLNPAIRIMNLWGFVVAAGGDQTGLDRAAEIWSDAYELAESTGHQALAWQIAHNLDVLELSRSGPSAPARWGHRIDRIIEPFLEHKDELRKLIVNLLDEIAGAAPLSDDISTGSIPVSFATIAAVRNVSMIESRSKQVEQCSRSYVI